MTVKQHPNDPPALHIVELTEDAPIAAAFDVMAQLRDRITRDTFLATVREQQAGGYHLLAAYAGGEIVALAGYRMARTLSRGPHLFVDDLVTDAAARGSGAGQALLRHLAAIARQAGVPRIHLDSRATAKGFYEKVGFTFITAIPCWIDVDRLV